MDRGPADLWGVFQKGVLAGLAGDLASARALLDTVASAEARFDWERERREIAQRLFHALDTSRLVPMIATMVDKTRALLRLTPSPTCA